MSYLALARKWRPTQFSEVVGQSHVLTALSNALSQNRLHHAYLFSGTRGVGKTTIGRLFAKGLNCETGVTAHPCGQCATCQEIDQGRFVDLLEIDAASRTKVEDTRELLDNVQYKPARGRFKVYLIDEVHMLSRHSFNALLKTLEEPPEYVKFLLATTDPQKLPVTILSRCLQFHLKPISPDDIEQQLEFILKEEGIPVQARALGLLAHAADGSMRDALSLTDQAIALGNGQIEDDVVAQMLGTLDTGQALHLIQALSDKQAQQVIDCVETMANNGIAWDDLLQTLAGQLHRIAMYQMLPSTLDKMQPDAEMIKQLAQSLSPEDVQLFYQIALKGREDLPRSPTPRIGLEMILLRMIAFRPVEASPIHLIQPQPTAAVSPVTPPSAAQASAVNTPEANLEVNEDSNSVEVVPQIPVESASTPVETIPGMQTSPSAQQKSTDFQSLQEDRLQPPLSVPQSQEVSRSPVQAPQSQGSQSQIPDSKRAQEELQQEEPQAASSSPLVGLRHQLRSQRLARSEEHPTKKPEATASQSQPATVFERLAHQHSSREATVPPSDPPSSEVVQSVLPPDEPYQWRPSIPVEAPTVCQPTPSELKQSLVHEKTPEMTAKLAEEVIQDDEWAAMIQKMTLPKLVEQLALNASYQRQDESVRLTLRQSHAHLNNDKALSTLNEALNQVLGIPCRLSVHMGEAGITPLEQREQRYQAKLAQAFENLNSDPNVQWFQRRFDAKLDEESVRPV
jgi:DNA polymerase-3 subunit gamma/tau